MQPHRTFAHAQFSLRDRPGNLVNIVSSARKRENICCENKIFLKKSETISVSRKQIMLLQKMFRSRKRGKIKDTCFLNNVLSFAGAFKK